MPAGIFIFRPSPCDAQLGADGEVADGLEGEVDEAVVDLGDAAGAFLEGASEDAYHVAFGDDAALVDHYEELVDLLYLGVPDDGRLAAVIDRAGHAFHRGVPGQLCPGAVDEDVGAVQGDLHGLDAVGPLALLPVQGQEYLGTHERQPPLHGFFGPGGGVQHVPSDGLGLENSGCGGVRAHLREGTKSRNLRMPAVATS